ncbi:sensor domain-containing diguanylate cyclase [Salinicola sp. RZ23]|uniref:sensor domain-containing diguanylate cyclase n=1 Tax=Salinicola sp. RZ23 TaxID=1949087 RepID=UPI000DA234AC|nr:sensor domain-containing diguanylate cyclase [Salinicola sp. RZ23]
MSDFPVDEQDLYKKRLQLTLEASGLDLWENNLSTGEVVFGLTKIFADLGYDKEEEADEIGDIFALMHPDDVASVEQAIDEHIKGRTERYYSEFRILAKDGQWVWYANYGKLIDDAVFGDRFIGVSFSLADKKRHEEELLALNTRLTEQNAQLERMNLELHALATRDSLTGVYNRRHLMEIGERECQRSRRFEHPLTLLLIDIDFFKQVNDTWGHVTGDLVIRAVADCCAQQVREAIDTVGRIGGEEFAIVLLETSLEAGLTIAERIRQCIADMTVATYDGEGEASVTLSIGVAQLAPTCRSFHDLMVLADRALYRAKHEGRNRIQGHDVSTSVS